MYLEKETRDFIPYELDLTRSTEKGFAIVDIPAPIYQLLSSWYDRTKMKPESYDSKDFYIKEDCFIQDINAFPKMVKFIKESMLEMHEVFAIVDIPAPIYQLLSSWYDRTKMKPESYNSKEFYIKEDCFIQDINSFPNMVKFIKESMLEMHEVFANRELEPAVVYGIRSYSSGSTLKAHYDRQDTHHIATSITMGKDAAWSLNIQDHDKQWWAVDVEPGQGIIFESGVCIHGRLDPFEGTYFDNIYTHYTFKEPHTPYEA